jgi:hypothetical protein
MAKSEAEGNAQSSIERIPKCNAATHGVYGSDRGSHCDIGIPGEPFRFIAQYFAAVA